MKEENLRFKEDKLFEKVFPLLKRTHRIPKNHKIEFHKRLRGYEIDVYVTCKSSSINLYKKIEDADGTNLSPNEKLILDTLDKYGATILRELVEATSLPRKIVQKSLRTLLEKGLIEKKPLSLSFIPVKSMIIELKEIDMPKLIEQVVKRRHLALFAYAVINIPPVKLFPWLIKYHLDLAQQLVDHKIGLISFDKDGSPVLLLRSDENLQWALDKFFKNK